MISLGVSSSLLLTILLLAVSYKTDSAPTHHLTIGVQGNTPTLIVTSSEIGITPQTMDSNEKIVKDSGRPKKPSKPKPHKNQDLSIKKDKVQLLTKSNVMKSLENNENSDETLNRISEASMLIRDRETTTLKMEALEITTTTETTPSITAESPQLTTLSPNQIHEDPLVLSSIPLDNSTQPEETSTVQLQYTTNTPTESPLISNDDKLNTFPVIPTTLSPKDFEDSITITNFNENTNTATFSDALMQKQTETKVNNIVLQTQKTTQTLSDKSFIKMENDNDRHMQTSISTTEDESLLLRATTIATNAFATPSTATAISVPTVVTLRADDVEPTTTSELLSLSVTMTTTATENVVDDDNNSNNNSEQQEPTTVHIDKSIHGFTEETYKEDSDKKPANLAKAESQKHDVVLSPKQGLTRTTTPTEQTDDETTSTKKPLKDEIEQTTHQSFPEEKTTNGYPEHKIETEALPPTAAIRLTSGSHQSTIVPFKANQEQQTTMTTKSANPSHEPYNTATTEAFLKLIDLEKHNVGTIAELKHPSLLMAGQHDNGHDGLKNIKKKQLVDKHYVEALFHNKQDVRIKESVKDEKHITEAAHRIERIVPSSPKRNYSLAVNNKPALVPIKHGYLGPILMEEKTFHVVHHTDSNMTDNQHHIDDIDSQLRKHHFVELKVKKEDNNSKEENNSLKNTNTNSFSVEHKEIMDMQSDQPVQSLESKNEQISMKNKGEKITKNVDIKKISQNNSHSSNRSIISFEQNASKNIKLKLDNKHKMVPPREVKTENINNSVNSSATKSIKNPQTEIPETSTEIFRKNSFQGEFDTKLQPSWKETSQKAATVLSTTVFQTLDLMATKTPMVQADTLFTAEDNEKQPAEDGRKQQVESKISDIQVEVYDSTVDSIVASTNFKDAESKHQSYQIQNDGNDLGKTTRPPIASIQQERFTQYVIDRTETSTHEPINYNTIQVASGKPEPAAIEIHINVSESFGNESDDGEFLYPQTEYGNSNNINNNREKLGEESYDDIKVNDNIKLKIPLNANSKGSGKELRNDEILVVEIIDTDNDTNTSFNRKSINTDELFVTDIKNVFTTPPPPPPPPPYQTNFDRDSDTIFYISNTEVKVGESVPSVKNANEERKLKLESQFFPANYMASTHSSLNHAEDLNPARHLYEEDIILSPSHNQADSLKIYRNNNEPSPPLDVTYVGESIIEVEQSPDVFVTTTYAPDQQHTVATPQADVIIQPAILPEISIGVPVIGELPPQIELKEIDFMPNEAQLRRSGIYDDNDSSNSNNDIDENTINGNDDNNNNNNHDVDIVSGNRNNKQRVDESSIQYGGDLIDESADGGFDGVEGSYPFGNPAVVGKSSPYSYTSAFFTKLRKQQQQQQQQKPSHVADYAHLYVNYGVNNMRKDELSADMKDSGEMLSILSSAGGSGNVNVSSSEQNTTSLKHFLSKVSMSNSTLPFVNGNFTHSERMSNATAFSVMEDDNDLENKNTEDIVNLISLAIGLFIVILPVVVTCSMFWALRYLYKKYHSSLLDNGGYPDQTETKGTWNENGVEKGEFVHEPSSSPTNSNKDTIEKYQETSKKPSTTDSRNEILSEKLNPQFENLPSQTNATTTTIAYSSSATVSKKNDSLRLSLTLSSPIAQKQNKTSPSASSPLLVVTTIQGDVVSEDDDDDDVEISGPNGSITIMTLENNLLIVETEERNDISRVARETKMDYNKDGVFVVEVARGIDSKAIPESPVMEGNEKMLSMFDTKQNNGVLGYKINNEKNCANNERVQVHSPPVENQEDGPRSLHQIEEVEEPLNSPHLDENNDAISGLVCKANTGLSQSDLSSTSSSDSNKGYCYGNQELYVVEEKGNSSIKPSGNVVLKCDGKDIKDDDRNPGNDRYLEHSPNRQEELNKNKEDVVESFENSEEKESCCEGSRDQKQNDALQEKSIVAIESSPLQKKGGNYCLENLGKKCTREQTEKFYNGTKSYLLPKMETPTEIRNKQLLNNSVPVEIEVHITPEEDQRFTDEKTLGNSRIMNKLPFIEKNQCEIVPSMSETVQGSIDVSSVFEATSEINSFPKENKHQVIDKADDDKIAAIPDKISDSETSKDDANSIQVLAKNICKLETIEEKIVLETLNENKLKEDKMTNSNRAEEELHRVESLDDLEENDNLESKEREVQAKIVIENYLESNMDTTFYINDSIVTEDTGKIQEENLLNIKKDLTKTTQEELTENDTSILPDECKMQQLQNGHDDTECSRNSSSEMENGYDSILSLPDPPTIIDEQQINYLSDQTLDSLPPPPPPEIFNLKDLPPPLANGNTYSPQCEDSNHFYNTLPPPPPTSLEITTSAATTTTAANGKVHASPLTPPASPPAHFTNNIHAGLCPQPIAVDVNGS